MTRNSDVVCTRSYTINICTFYYNYSTMVRCDVSTMDEEPVNMHDPIGSQASPNWRISDHGQEVYYGSGAQRTLRT
jgi:hypothetical protein